MIEIDDFVMLGTTVPEPNSDGRVFVCSAGVSPQLRSLIRIYPLARHGIPKRWHTYAVKLERPAGNHDSRPESWKVAGDRGVGAHDRINQRFTLTAPKLAPARRKALLEPYVVPSIRYANERRMSLAILQPEHLDLSFDHNPQSPDSPQLALFDAGDRYELPFGAKRFAWMPRLSFRDEDGTHRLMLRDWGCYELMRKHGDDYARQHMADAMHLSADSSLLVGNLNNQRNAWLVIGVLNGLRSPMSLFESVA